MHCSYYFLRNLSFELGKLLTSSTLVDCFTQTKNELIFSFLIQNTEWHLLVDINRGFNGIALKSDFHKAKSKYQNLFRACTNRKVSAIVQTPFDRSFYILLENNYKIVFKMHGNRSNIVLIDEKDNVNALFNQKLRGDLTLKIEELQKPEPTITVDNLEDSPSKILPLLGKNIHQYVENNNWKNLAIAEREEKIKNIHQAFSTPTAYYLTNTIPAKITLWKEKGTVFTAAIEASNKLYNELNYYLNFKVKKEEILTQLSKKIRLTDNYITKCEQELLKLENRTSFKQKADVLMANLHLVTEIGKTYRLLNFYTNKEIEVTLKKGEKPQNLASKWYKKEKNQHLELANFKEKIAQKKGFVEELRNEQEFLQEIESIKALNQYLKKTTPKATQKEISQFKESHFQGYDIYIGRNSKNNDELCKFGRKNDLWLHAKDVTGSHVLVKSINQTNFPKSVIEYAASLAAYYSKRKQDSLCPVIYTELKYIKKRKGFLAGQVSVERENVVMVKPKGL